MNTQKKSRLLSWLLVIAMVISMVPTFALAAEPAVYTKITAAEQLTTGKYVMTVDTGYAPGVLDGTWITAQAVTAEGDTVKDPAAAAVWDITVNENGVVLTDSNGVSVGPKAENANGIKAEEYNWGTTCTNGTFQFVSQEGTVTLASNAGDPRFENKFRAYKNTTIAGRPESYPCDFTLFKLDGEAPVPTDPTDPTTPAPTDPTEPVVPPVTEAPIKAGDQVVIYNPANMKALSSVYNGHYNTGVDVTLDQGVLSGYADTEIWTVGVNEDGTYTFSTADGKKLSMGEKFSSMPLDEVNPNWEVTSAATEGCYYIKNTARGNYVEWFADKNNWSSYGNIGQNEALFAQAFYVIPSAREEGIVTELMDGDTVVVFNPANKKALSTTYTGFFNNGTDVTLTDGKLSGYTDADVWTVGVNADGTYTFSTADGKKLAMGEKFSSMPLDEVNQNWEISPAATADCFYIKNTVRGNYMEWYADKNNWSSFRNIGENEALFAQQFYLVVEETKPDPKPEAGLPAAGEQVVLYNLGAQGVLSLQNDNTESPAINNVSAAVAENKATTENGGLVFTVEVDGEYYRFHNETFGYLCSNGTGNNAFYSQEATEDADWTLAQRGEGYTMESRTAKFNGKYSQFLEFYADSYKTYSMNKVTDYNIFTFQFLPCANEKITAGVVNEPKFICEEVPVAFVGAPYELVLTPDSVFGIKSLKCDFTHTLEDVLTVSLTAEEVSAFKEAGKFVIELSGEDNKGVTFTQSITVEVKDEPVISEVTPAAGSQTGENMKPVISAKLMNIGENAKITMTVNNQEVETTFADGVVSYTPAADMAQGRTTVTVTVVRADGKEATKTWAFTVGKTQYQLYFGQLHSHTGEYSDGSGKLEDALSYVENLPESANVDFVAFTDHSNYFDTKNEANPEGALYDMNLATAESKKIWSKYKSDIAAFNEKQNKVIAMGGFEMTWSGGPGHINTFVTPGIVSRNNKTLNNKTNDAGMKAYYALLSQPEGVNSINQFNHPGTTFGNFTDFSYWDAVIDSRMYLVEVGNGEGQIGAGGYYPSYEQYTLALDKGWHVAPTNNQDNHKGKWGNANDARDVILTDNFTEDGLYEAIRNYRVYATEDKNLEIGYTVNGQMLGSIIEEVPEKLNVNVTVFDPDSSDTISKVEVIVNSGKVAHTWDNAEELAAGELTVTLDPTYSYYYIRVTEADGDLAVTSPVWVGETLKLGITSATSSTATPVTDEELTITTTLFNSESTEAKVKSVTYTTNGSEVLATDTTGYTVPASGTAAVEWKYTPTAAKLTKITVTVVMELNGEEYTFSNDLELDVLDAETLVYVGIDASHYNEYVSGNYKDSMGNFGNLAAGYSVRTVELKTSEDLIAACTNPKYKMLILTVPSRRDGTALRDPYANYSDAEIQAIVDFNKAGGSVVLSGWSDYYENYAQFPAADHMAAQQNKLLAALGSSLRIGDDATNDDTLNGGQTQRLYFSTYNMDSFLMKGVEFDAEHPNDKLYTQLFSQYGGASVYAVDAQGNPTTQLPATVTPVVYGHSSTYSKDSDNDGLGGENIPKYPVAENDSRLLVLGTEQIEGQGLIVVSGAAFMSNFEVQANLDNAAEKNYSNYTICENLMQFVNPVVVTDIAKVHAQTEPGYKFTIEGVVTSNASGHDKNTAFFDCIYVQDKTAGINCFPVAGDYKVGDVVRITGTTSAYQGESQLQVTAISKLGEQEPVKPTSITAADMNSGKYLGSLVTISGTVVNYTMANGLVESIYVKDDSGEVARVFIDGYITKDVEIANLEKGCSVTATGLASYDNTYAIENESYARLRIRDRGDIVCTAGGHVHTWGEWTVEKEATCLTEGSRVRVCSVCGEEEHEVIPVNPDNCLAKKFTDVDVSKWYHEALEYVLSEGIMEGVDETRFSPNGTLTRGQLVTVLYRMAGEPAVEETASFVDVAENRFYTDAVSWAYKEGIAKGVTEEHFAPGKAVTREQMVTFLFRYADKIAHMDVSGRADLSKYPDADKIMNFAEEAFAWAVDAKLIKGLDDGTLAPRNHSTRAQVAEVLMRMDTIR